MKNVFVSSQFRGNVKRNVWAARQYCAFVLKQGNKPFAPHLFYTQFMDDDVYEERVKGIEFCMMDLRCSDEIWVFIVDGVISEGMEAEMNAAKKMSMPMRIYNVSQSTKLDIELEI
jgi:hypothetical protein